ncbi:nucleoside-diphosphate kinase [Patescibacteria group bacterium]
MTKEILNSPEQKEVDMQESTLVLIKPEGVQRGLIGEIIKRFENKGLKIKAMKMITINKVFAEKHYEMHKEKPFFDELVNHIASSPIVAIVLEGCESIQAVRNLVGSTNPLNAEPGTIRHDFCLAINRNLVHASDSPETADKEIKYWFEELST